MHIQGPYGISRSPAPPFKLARLVHIANADARGEFCLLETHRATTDNQRGLFCHRSRLYGLRWPLAGQSGDLTIQGCHNGRQRFHPLCRPLTTRESHLLSVLVPKEPLSQGTIEALNNALVP
ncbi:MAG: hypothetical protein AB2556_26245, partial [Candidatus Thiodiazotropha sp.]